MGGLHTTDILSKRELFRDNYWLHKDPIFKDRLLWRAQTFRHLVHLLPKQSILELGCGQGLFTQQLLKVSRGENPITAVTFGDTIPPIGEGNGSLQFMRFDPDVNQLDGKQFDFIVALDVVDASDTSGLLEYAYGLLKPGGQLVLYESNPRNPFLKANKLLSSAFELRDSRNLYSKKDLEERVKKAGFINAFVAFNDFAYAPLTGYGSWLLENASVLLENMPYVNTLAGSLLVHAHKASSRTDLPVVSLCEHEHLKQSISVVIPCHNEEMNVTPLVTRLMELYGQYIFEIILVDDNSSDNTRNVIKQLAEKYPVIKPVFRTPPNGVGRAIMDGYKVATGQYILSMDCDFQHLLPELRDLFDAAGDEVDVVIGSRFSRHSVLINYPFQKIVANRAFHLLARVMLHTKFRDVTNNLKLIRREVVQKMDLTQPGFSINAETGLLPILMGCVFKEVPISWINRTADMGVSSFKLVKVGGGYWQVLRRLWYKKVFA